MSPRTVFRIFIVLLAVSLLKHFWLAGYCHPMADDWSYAHQGITRALLPWLQGEYMNWNGRYFSNILVGNGPLVLGPDALWLYRLVPVALMLLTVLAAYALICALTRGAVRRWEQWAAAVVFFALFVQGMPDIREGIYWYTGAITYQLGNILALFHVARVIGRPQRGTAGRSWTGILFDAVLLVLLIGCSEVHMVLMLAFHTAAIVLRRRKGSPMSNSDRLLPFVALIGAVIVIAAPGNTVRSALFTGAHDPLHSLWMSALQTARFAALWSSNAALLLVSILYLPVSRSLALRLPHFADAFNLKPWMSTIALLAVIFLCVFPAYWGTGILGQHRTVNVAYCFFLVLWFINLTVWDRHVLQRRWASWPRLSTRWTALVLLAILALINLDRNGGGASRDLFSGRAVHFDEQLTARYGTLDDARASGREPVLPIIHDPPATLSLYELRGDPLDWVNQCYALYFGMEGRPVHRQGADDRAPSRP